MANCRPMPRLSRRVCAVSWRRPRAEPPSSVALRAPPSPVRGRRCPTGRMRVDRSAAHCLASCPPSPKPCDAPHGIFRSRLTKTRHRCSAAALRRGGPRPRGFDPGSRSALERRGCGAPRRSAGAAPRARAGLTDLGFPRVLGIDAPRHPGRPRPAARHGNPGRSGAGCREGARLHSRCASSISAPARAQSFARSCTNCRMRAVGRSTDRLAACRVAQANLAACGQAGEKRRPAR